MARRSRFSSTEDSDGLLRKPGLLETFLFDLRPARGESARIATERIRALTHTGVYLTGSHSICAIVLSIYALSAGYGADPLRVLVPLAAVLLLAGLTSFYLNRQRTQNLPSHVVVSLWIIFTLTIGGLWCAIIGFALPEAQTLPPLVLTALLGAFCLTVAGFMDVPVLLVASCLIAVIACAFFEADAKMLVLLIAFGACLLSASLFGAQGALMAAARRISTEQQARKAANLLAEFEQSGRGWFWETDNTGALTYVSEALAAELKQEAEDLKDAKLTELIHLDEEQTGSERTLAFYLSGRLSFSEVAVRAKAEEEIWWSLSGTPHFDDVGRFTGYSGIGSDLSEKRRVESEMNKLARYDALTGLANRVMMKETLTQSIKAIAQQKKGCALFLIDLDRFKNVNDTLGHPVGDALLKQVSQRLTAVIGKQGRVGRIGGDEFEAIFPAIDSESLLADLAYQLIERVSQPYLIDGSNISIGASVGIAIAHTHYQCPDALVRDADLALYAAKDAGRGVHKIFAPNMHTDAQEKQSLEQDLRGALDRGELTVLYQPVVKTQTEALVGFEALIRWNHPQRGLIPTGEFIALAEECNLVGGIGEWVLRTACAEAAKWPNGLRVAVNISPVQFANPNLVTTVMNALASSGLEPDRLELEITEGVFLSETPHLDETFGRLKASGVRLALDDFGTGYSSLGYLKRAPLDKLKIDQSFVRGAAAAGSTSEAILRSIISLAQSLKMDTTAEGVESHDDLRLIRELGCSQVQGYIFGKPMPAEDALRLASQEENLEATGFQNERPPRQSLLRKANLQWNGLTFAVRVRNISSGGLMVESPRELPVDAPVQIEMFGCGTFGALVRWCDEERIGLRFDKPFDLRKLGPTSAPSRLRRPGLLPEYLSTELESDSPWAARNNRLSITELRKLG